MQGDLHDVPFEVMMLSGDLGVSPVTTLDGQRVGNGEACHLILHHLATLAASSPGLSSGLRARKHRLGILVLH